MFEDPVKVQTANLELWELKQACHPVAEYINDFRLISQDLRWNEETLMGQFHECLSSEILDELAQINCPSILQALMHLCLRIDGWLQ